MLTTLIYRSHIRDDEPVKKIEEMVSIANRRNMQSDVTGILLFNGSHFFQLLEGPEEQVKMIYRAICQDPRHYNIVELLCDYAPARRFGKAGMELFDLRLHERDDVLQAVFDKGTSKFQLTYDDRALQFFRTFVLATEQSTYFEIPAEDSWLFIADGSDKELDSCALSPTINDHFAFHPIVDPLSRRIIAFEAIVQKNEDSPSAIAVGQRKDGEIYTADLKSKALAFTMAHALELGDKMISFQLTYDDRALQFFRTFVLATEQSTYFEIPAEDSWLFIADGSDKELDSCALSPTINDHFAFHPIVDPLSRRIIAFEAIVQKNEDSPSAIAVGQRKDGEIYTADLKSKALAFTMAHALELGDKMISINLLPMTLVNEPDAVSFLLNEIKANALVPEQIIVEFTESEVISRFDEFAEAIKSLKAAGISVAIDHFGAGFAGLLLLSRFQPDRIKISQELITNVHKRIKSLKAAGISVAIDHFGAGFAGLLLLSRFQPDRIKISQELITNVHKSGPRQAIIQAIIKCCTSLEIQVSAMGVATPEEWMWLESAGIEMFQGDLFAKAKLNGIPSIAWPEKK